MAHSSTTSAARPPFTHAPTPLSTTRTTKPRRLLTHGGYGLRRPKRLSQLQHPHLLPPTPPTRTTLFRPIPALSTSNRARRATLNVFNRTDALSRRSEDFLEIQTAGGRIKYVTQVLQTVRPRRAQVSSSRPAANPVHSNPRISPSSDLSPSNKVSKSRKSAISFALTRPARSRRLFRAALSFGRPADTSHVLYGPSAPIAIDGHVACCADEFRDLAVAAAGGPLRTPERPYLLHSPSYPRQIMVPQATLNDPDPSSPILRRSGRFSKSRRDAISMHFRRPPALAGPVARA
ncbi:hypothetical protein C8T65DRAFT_145524 [Cerioporus squamosus]|nr:hypothetical protein C8T65DRAFT_145524 [Cerioporus squamosus]